MLTYGYRLDAPDFDVLLRLTDCQARWTVLLTAHPSWGRMPGSGMPRYCRVKRISQITMSSPRVRAVEFYRSKIIAWYGENARAFPWRTTRDSYRVLVGEMLLQRTRGEAVASVFGEFLRRWPDPHRLERGARVNTQTRAATLGPHEAG